MQGRYQPCDCIRGGGGAKSQSFLLQQSINYNNNNNSFRSQASFRNPTLWPTQLVKIYEKYARKFNHSYLKISFFNVREFTFYASFLRQNLPRVGLSISRKSNKRAKFPTSRLLGGGGGGSVRPLAPYLLRPYDSDGDSHVAVIVKLHGFESIFGTPMQKAGQCFPAREFISHDDKGNFFKAV